MTPKEFKERWSPNELNRWTQFVPKELNKLPVSYQTKEWLHLGYPRDAAPFLSFGLEIYDHRFYSVADCYSSRELNPKTKNYWIFGSDGSGNPICIDIENDDRILLLDHEESFEILCIVNSNLYELSQCLILLKDFISHIQSDLGDDAYFDAKYTRKHVYDLKQKFEVIQPGLLLTSEFWSNEIDNLLNEIE